MVALVDTNILVYRFDNRFPRKQHIATQLLREGIERNTLRVPHVAIAAVSLLMLAVMSGEKGQGHPDLTDTMPFRDGRRGRYMRAQNTPCSKPAACMKQGPRGDRGLMSEKRAFMQTPRG